MSRWPLSQECMCQNSAAHLHALFPSRGERAPAADSCGGGGQLVPPTVARARRSGVHVAGKKGPPMLRETALLGGEVSLRWTTTGRGQCIKLSSILTYLVYAVFAVLLALGLLASVNPARALDLDKLTVVTMAPDGSWGVATAGSHGPAIAAAIRDCRAMAGAQSDCGA
jgi:hypothetical protein